MMQNVTSFIQKVALHSRIHDRNFVFSSFPPHALKGQKLLAKGIALGNYGSKPVAL